MALGRPLKDLFKQAPLEFPDGKPFPYLSKTEKIILERLIPARKEGIIILRIELVEPLYHPPPGADLRKYLPKVNSRINSLRTALTASGWRIDNVTTNKKGEKIVGGIELKRTDEPLPLRPLKRK